MSERIYLSAPDVRDEERRFLANAIDSNWIAPTGPDLEAFEAQIAALAGRSFAVGVVNGTAALHLALLVAGVGPGDQVLTSTFTFIGSASPIVHCGAEPVFIDSESTTWNLCPQLLSDELASCAKRGSLPAAVVSVDLYGASAEYDEILAVCAEYDVPLIEDAAEALGASYRGASCGSFGQSAILSFNGNKIVTTSGGGAFVSDDERLIDRARYLASNARENTVHYEHYEVGYNYRLSNLLAAFGRGQVSDLRRRIERRKQIHNAYAAAVADVPSVDLHTVPEHHEPNYWLSCLEISQNSNTTVEALRIQLESDNIESRPLWKPMHLQPVFSNARSRTNGVSQALFGRGVCLPSSNGMSDDDVERVVASLHRALR